MTNFFSKEALTWPSMKRYKVLGCTNLIGYIFSLKCDIRMVKSHYKSGTGIVTATILRCYKWLHPCNQSQNVDNMWNVFPLWFCKDTRQRWCTQKFTLYYQNMNYIFPAINDQERWQQWVAMHNRLEWDSWPNINAREPKSKNSSHNQPEKNTAKIGMALLHDSGITNPTTRFSTSTHLWNLKQE
jgi:hypothetical protein